MADFDAFAQRHSQNEEVQRQDQDRHSAMWPEFLRLKDVAVTFLDRGERNGVPQNCRIRFTRRPLEPGRAWVDNETPLAPLEWSLEPVIEGENLAWYVPELGETFSPADLAEKIAIELCNYHTAYEEAYGRLPVVRRFGLE
jgi:hypothetical protein